MDKETEHEIMSLSAETMALQILLLSVIRRLPKADIEAAFNEATDHGTIISMKLGTRDNAPHMGTALKVIEQLREAVMAS